MVREREEEEQKPKYRSDKELKQLQQAESLDRLKNVGKEIGKVIVSIAKVPVGGLQWLGRENAKNARRSSRNGNQINLGFGSSKPARKPLRLFGTKSEREQQVFKRTIDEGTVRAIRIKRKVRAAKIKRARQNR